MTRYTKPVLLTLALAATGALAHSANGGMEDEALAIANAKVSLAQAVTTAEQHAHGRATRAEYEHATQGWVYDVDVVSGAKVFEVRVDGATGTVVSSVEDQADQDDDDEQD